MSLEQLQQQQAQTPPLKADVIAIQAKVMELGALTTTLEVIKFMQDELVPLIGSVVDETIDIDETVQDMYAQAEDILQPETAGEFAALIIAGRSIVGMLMKRLGDAADADVKKAVKEFMELSRVCEKTLEEVTVPPEDDDEDEDEDEDDDKDDDKEKK